MREVLYGGKIMDIKKQNNESDNSYIARLYKNKTAMGYTNKRIS